MKEFVEYVVKNLVDKPHEVCVNEVAATNTLIVELRVAKRDIGKVIGKRGKNINALRTLLTSAANPLGVRVTLEIVEEKQTYSESQGSC